MSNSCHLREIMVHKSPFPILEAVSPVNLAFLYTFNIWTRHNINIRRSFETPKWLWDFLEIAWPR